VKITLDSKIALGVQQTLGLLEQQTSLYSQWNSSLCGPQIFIPEKCGNIGWNMKQVLLDIVMKSHLKHDVPQYRNLSRKCTTSLIRRHNHNGEVVDSW